ncbi:peptidyl-tRNA hydrolase, partial [Blyttiomyces helicus]
LRIDLEMSKGKVAAQCAHAALAAYKAATTGDERSRNFVSDWERTGQAKITLKCPTEDLMVDLARAARSAGLTAQVIRDAGRTQIASGSKTVLAIGPGPVELVDSLTKDLKLY